MVTDEELWDLCHSLESYREVASKTGLAYQTVKNRMCQIRKRVTSRSAIAPDVSEAIAEQIRSDNSTTRRYVITSAQNATPVFLEFFESLETFCEHNEAQLMVIPLRYRNPTSLWSSSMEDDEWWATAILPYLCDKRIELEENVMIMGDIKTQPTAVRPLSGFDDFTDHNSAVFGHTRLEFKSIATPKGCEPKFLMTTGCVTEPNYSDSKAGKRGENSHRFGATLIEIDQDGDVFFRQLLADKDGSFIDKDSRYTKSGVMKASSALGLVTGDTHALFADKDVIKATHTNDDSIVNSLMPKTIVFHDVHDHYSRNHHHKSDFLLNYAKHHSGYHNVKNELMETFALIDDCTPDFARSIIVRSNHDEALDRWLKETDFKQDPENAEFYLETMLACVQAMNFDDGRPKTIDPLAFWGERMLKSKNVSFLKRDESHMIGNIEVGYHGDKGPDGSFATPISMNKLGVEVVYGHGHSALRYGNVIRVGVSCDKDMGYNKGPSSWSHTHNIIYANGQSSFITIVNGKWCA